MNIQNFYPTYNNIKRLWAYVTGINNRVKIIEDSDTSFSEITGDPTDNTALSAALTNKVTKNTAITGATKTKLTYDSKGLITAGADATTADIADSTDKRYVTDTQLTKVGNLPTNTTTAISSLRNVIDVTYAQITALITASTLIPSQVYRITDYQSVMDITNVGVAGVQTIGPVEPLLVTAYNTNTLGTRAISTTYPTDIIEYSISNDQAVTSVIGSTKGVILSRHDITRNIKAPWDWRNVYVRRWKFNPAAWSSATTYTQGQVVSYSGKIYFLNTGTYAPGPSATSLNQQPDTNPSVWTCAIKDYSRYICAFSTGLVVARSNISDASSQLGNITIPCDVNDYVDVPMIPGLETYGRWAINNITIEDNINMSFTDNTGYRVRNYVFYPKVSSNTTFNLMNIKIVNCMASITFDVAGSSTGISNVNIGNALSNYHCLLQSCHTVSGSSSLITIGSISGSFIISGLHVRVKIATNASNFIMSHGSDINLETVSRVVFPQWTTDLFGYYFGYANFRYNASLQQVRFANWGLHAQGDTISGIGRTTFISSPLRNIEFIGSRIVGDQGDPTSAITAAINATTTGVIFLDYVPYEVIPNNYLLASKLTVAAAPATATSTGVAGTVILTSTYIYTCVATNTWVRTAVATW